MVPPLNGRVTPLRSEWDGAGAFEREAETGEHAQVGGEANLCQTAHPDDEAVFVLEAAELALDAAAAAIQLAPLVATALHRDGRLDAARASGITAAMPSMWHSS